MKESLLLSLKLPNTGGIEIQCAMVREKEWKKFDSFEQAESAEDEFYRRLTPDERVSILLQLIGQYNAVLTTTLGADGSSGRFERVFRVVALKES